MMTTMVLTAREEMDRAASARPAVEDRHQGGLLAQAAEAEVMAATVADHRSHRLASAMVVATRALQEEVLRPRQTLRIIHI